jgi:CHAT domain-containing protein
MMSACQTGLGASHPDSMIGLANVFMIAGANTVGSTLWQIPDDVTVELMTGFYTRLIAGRDTAAALREAQLEVLRRPATAPPECWAAFRLTGWSGSPVV